MAGKLKGVMPAQTPNKYKKKKKFKLNVVF